MPHDPTGHARSDRFARRYLYHSLLLTMALLHMLTPALVQRQIGVEVLRFAWVLTLVLSVVAMRRRWIEWVVATVLLGLALVGELQGEPWHGAAGALSVVCRGLFMLQISGLILRELSSHPVVTLGTISGAFVVYMFMAGVFTEAYDLADRATEGDFLHGLLAAEEVHDLPQHLERQSQLFYFSLVTMTTLGYGDITPSDEFARSLATLQAVLGQAYLAVLIARLVSLYRAPTHESRSADPTP